VLENLVETFVDLILGLRGVVAYAVVGVLAWAEAAFFLGLITPGEIAMVLGGVLASRDQAEVVTMATVASTGTILGNSTGYWLGRRWGRRLTDWSRFERRFGTKFGEVEEFFEDRGGRAIVVGRFASFLRVFIPFIAGMARMSYGRFLLFDVPTSAAWASGFVFLGYVLGRSWEVVHSYAGPASALILALIALGLLLRWAARRAIAHREEILALFRQLRATRPLRFLEHHYGTQLAWMARRFNPRLAQGLGFTLSFALFVAATGFAGYILSWALSFEGISRIDLPALSWVDRVRTEEAETVGRVVLTVVSPPWVLIPVVAYAAAVAWRGSRSEGARLLLGAGGATLLAWSLDVLLREGTAGTQLPVVAVAVVASLVVHTAALAGVRGGWPRGVISVAVGVFLLSVVGLAGVLANEAAPTGIAFGLTLGVAWSAAIEAEGRLPPHLRDGDGDGPHSAADTPEPAEPGGEARDLG
jgi:membrane protein DedA with SNARE-associated domain